MTITKAAATTTMMKDIEKKKLDTQQNKMKSNYKPFMISDGHMAYSHKHTDGA